MVATMVENNAITSWPNTIFDIGDDSVILFRQALIDKFLEPAASVPDIDIALGIAGNDMDVGKLSGIVAGRTKGRARDFLQGLAVQNMHPLIVAVRDIEKALLLVAGQGHPE